MELRTPFLLKIAYVVVLLGYMLPIGLASMSWVRLATGGHFRTVFGILVILVVGAWRIYTVFRHPGTLDSPRVDGFPRLLRWVGMACLYVGAVFVALNMVSRPIMAALVTKPSETGIEFFMVGMYLAKFAALGWSGLMAFEASRLLAFEQRERRAP